MISQCCLNISALVNPAATKKTARMSLKSFKARRSGEILFKSCNYDTFFRKKLLWGYPRDTECRRMPNIVSSDLNRVHCKAYKEHNAAEFHLFPKCTFIFKIQKTSFAARKISVESFEGALWCLIRNGQFWSSIRLVNRRSRRTLYITAGYTAFAKGDTTQWLFGCIHLYYTSNVLSSRSLGSGAILSKVFF